MGGQCASKGIHSINDTTLMDFLIADCRISITGIYESSLWGIYCIAPSLTYLHIGGASTMDFKLFLVLPELNLGSSDMLLYIFRIPRTIKLRAYFELYYPRCLSQYFIPDT